MRTTSQLYKDIVAGDHYFEVQLTINSNVVNENAILSIDRERSLLSDDKPTVGGAAASRLSLKILRPNFTIPKMGKIELSLRARNSNSTSEWLNAGTYYVDTREYSDSSVNLKILNITAYDAMLMFEQDYPDTTHDWPYPDIQVLQEMATAVGVTVDSRTASYITENLSIDLPVSYTMREVLQNIAAAYGGNFVITDDNALLFVPLYGLDSGSVIDLGSSLRTLYLGHKLDAVTRVVVNTGLDGAGRGTTYVVGNTSGYTLEVNTIYGSVAVAQKILDDLSNHNFRYQPFDATYASLDPAAELGDPIKVKTTSSIVFTIKTKYTSLMRSDISAPYDVEVDHEFTFEPRATREFKREAKYTRSRLTINAEAITAEVSRATSAEGVLSANINITAEAITSEVSRAQSAEGNLSTRIDQRLDKITLAVSSSEGSSTFTIKDDNVTLDTKTLNLTVAAANISGKLTVGQLANGSVVISSTTEQQYYLSTSSSSATGGSWSNKMPTWSTGKYVWTRSKTTNTMNDNTTKISYSPSVNGVYDSSLTEIMETAEAAQGVSGATSAQQVIYKSVASGLPEATTTWITNTTGNQNVWTLKRPTYSSNYPALYIATQTKTLGGTITCTTPMLDTTTTVIDGSHITTGTIAAERIDAANLEVRAAKIQGLIKASQLEVGGGENLYANYDSFEQINNDTISYLSYYITASILKTQYARDGSKVLRLATGEEITTSNPPRLWLGDSSNDYGQIRLPVGNYIFSCYVGRYSGTAPTQFRVRVYGRTERSTDWNDTTKFSILKGVTNEAVTGVGSWKTRIEAPFTVTSGYPFVCIQFACFSTNTIYYVDCCQIEPIESLDQGAGPWHAASTTVINGGSITTGSINADLITTGTINADLIKAGSLSATRISGGTLDFNNISVNNLTVGMLNTGLGGNLYPYYDSFEQVTDSDITYMKASTCTVTIETIEDARAGNKVLKILASANAADAYVHLGKATNKYGQIYLEPGYYVASCYVRPAGSYGSSFRMSVRGRESIGSTWGSGDAWTALGTVVSTTKVGKWLRLEVPFQINSSDNYRYVSLRFAIEIPDVAYSRGNYVDCIQIEQVSNASQGAGPWTSAGTTTINGNSITTGQIAAERINTQNLEVSAANITGRLTASQIDATNLKVTSANITGMLSASQISVGMGGNLYSTYDTFQQVPNAADMITANKSASVTPAIVESQYARSGTKVLKLTVADTVTESNVFLDIGVQAYNYGEVRLTSGRYIASCYVIAYSGGGSKNFAMRVYGMKSLGKSWTSGDYKSYGDGSVTIGTSKQWPASQRVQVKFELDTNYPYVFLRFRSLSAGTVYYVDCCQIEKVDSADQNAGNWSPASATIITGNSITTGTLNADLINAGTLNVDRISAGSITTGKLEGGINTNLGYGAAYGSAIVNNTGDYPTYFTSRYLIAKTGFTFGGTSIGWQTRSVKNAAGTTITIKYLGEAT